MKKALFILLAVTLLAAIPAGTVLAKKATIEVGRGYEGQGSFTYSKTWDGEFWDFVEFYAFASFEGALEVKDEGLFYLKPPAYVTVFAEFEDEERVFNILIRPQGRPVMYWPDEELIHIYGDAEIVGTGIKGIVIIKDELCNNEIISEFKFYGYSNPEKAWVVIEGNFGECGEEPY
jgi:hypothetical protein